MNKIPDEYYAELVDDFSRTLDLDAGLADATQPGHYSAMAHDLAHVLDLDTGLEAILTPTKRSTSTVELKTPVPARNFAVDLALLLSSLDPPTRLHLRADPHYADLLRAVQLAAESIRARDRDLNLASDLNRDLDRARTRACDLVRDLNLNRARDLDYDLNRARDLVRDLNLARTRARDLDYDLNLDRARDLARDLNRALDRAFDYDLNRARARARDLNRALNRALDRDLDRARTRTLNRARDCVERDLERVRFCVSTFVQNLGLNLDPANSSILKPEDIGDLLMVLEKAAVDFTSADLRAVPLVGVHLEGIRWSSATLWPPEWEERISAESIEIDDGIFIIRGKYQQEAYITT